MYSTMEANDFIAKLKADGSANDLHDLDKVYANYKELLEILPSKDKGTFSLNVLCILCRNIDKVPSWRDKIDTKALLTLSIDCVRQTRGLEKPERVKVLACVYHIHKFIVRQPSHPPPELVLKLSYMPFEYEQDNLLSEYCKTYWNLLADRLMFIEKFKTGRRAIIKLLPKLIEDIQKVILIYDSVQFCNTILVFLLKKLHFLYNTAHAKELNKSFGMIFESLSLKKDVKSFKKLTEKEMLELFVKFSDCFYVIAENATKLNFQDSVLTAAVRSCIPFIGHAPELFHCLQTFYLNSFCCILTDNDNPSINETVLNSLIISCETTEKMGYLKAMRATYPYINQLLRVFIEYNLSKLTLTEETQETCLKLIILLLDKLKDTEQLLKCDNCKIKSGLHDALRLSFMAKNFVSVCLNSKLDVNMILQPYLMIIKKQHSILTDLCRLGCSNHEKYLRKLQTDIHNTAILLNKSENYNSAIQLFDLYLRHEFLHFKAAQDFKNISRALYNKSICELDCRMYEKALLDGFLSLVFAQPEGLSSEKYMGLVMDVKAKALKGCDDEELQMITVLDACNVAVERKLYGNLKPFFSHLEFNTLLHHEFTLYGRLWPSLSPVAGVWRALHFLSSGKRYAWMCVVTSHPVWSSMAVISHVAGVWRALHYLSSGKRYAWMCAQPPSLDTLYSVILHTPTVVRTIHSAQLSAILSSILDKMARTGDVKIQVIEATLMFLKAEMDLTDAAVKYEWKIKDQSIDPDLVPCCRTLEQEHKALRPALRGVKLWTEVLSRLDAVPQDFLTSPLLVLRVMLQQLLHVRSVYALQLAHVALRVSQHLQDRQVSIVYYIVLRVMLQQLLHVRSVYALQLAHVALRVSQHLQDRPAYLEAAGVILSRAYRPSEHLRRILSVAAEWAARMMEDERTREAALVFLCDAAIFYHNTKQAAASAKLIRVVQAGLLNEIDSMPIAIGRVLDAQALYGDLSASVNAQRHYLTVGNNETTWCLRQRRSLLLKQSIFSASLRAVSLSRSLRLRRRGRAAAACALGSASAEARLAVCVAAMDPSRCDVARVTIDQRLKHIVGLQSNECALQIPIQNDPKTAPSTPQLEAVRDARIPKKYQTSPSIPIEYVAAFKTPEFFDHDAKCECYACETPSIFILACQLLGMEASVYYRGREFDVAKNYFNGVIENFCDVESKMKAAMRKLREKFEKYVVDIIEKSLEKELFNVELEVLIEAAYYELSQKNYAKSDDYIYVRISEILQAADVDGYTKNEIMNLMTASEILRSSDNIQDRVADIENDLENLKLTPTKEILKTPEAKLSQPPVFDKVIVSKDELPDLKCKIPALNFDEPEEQIVPEKKINFKIPIPITNKAVLETITPRPSRSKVKILVTAPYEEDIDVAMTPQTDKSKAEFFTPYESTPDQFFTPQTSVKTYAKKSLRQNIVKNLEQEFTRKEIPKDSKRLSEAASVDDTIGNVTKDMKRISNNISPEGDSKENAKPNIPKAQKIDTAKNILEPKRGRVETGSLSKAASVDDTIGNVTKDMKRISKNISPEGDSKENAKPNIPKPQKIDTAKNILEPNRGRVETGSLSKAASVDDTKGNVTKDMKRISKDISPEGDSKENAKPNIPKPQKIEVVKNVLEPKRGKVETGSLRTLKDRRLKRSTSPGHLPKEDVKDNPRTRLKKPAVKVQRDDKK
ncbi:uncharacterized protein LOC134752408 [Cydia strobilella]|uniref:uncharacterized protein LOC134752408 n=1 Tax=Cydia strobilella TaxID=1100964 RepID=UPI003003FFD2